MPLAVRAALALSVLAAAGCGSPGDRLQADLAAHPGYQADMNALIDHLAGGGIAASWPGGYGDSKTADAIYLSLAPSDANSAASPLAQRIYQKMVAIRQKDGYGDQAATCFVHVLDSTSTREIAVDRAGSQQ